MKKIILLVLVFAILFIPTTAEAKTNYKYTTKKVNLREKPKGKIVYQVPRNTKVQLIKNGKVWSKIKYKSQKLSVKKKYLNPERLPNKKQSRKYIKHLHTIGPVHWHGRKYTYYTSRALPIWKLPVPGIHLDKNGFFCDKNDYIVLGSSRINKANRAVIATPFGKYGRVYDTGAVTTPSWLCDCATNW